MWVKFETGYTPDEIKKVLQKRAIEWSLDSFTKNGIVIYRYSKWFLILSYNADRSRQHFRAFLKKDAEGKTAICGHFGIPLLPYMLMFGSMVGIAGKTGGVAIGFLTSVVLIGIYLIAELIATINTKSKKAIISFIESELTKNTGAK